MNDAIEKSSLTMSLFIMSCHLSSNIPHPIPSW